jgi:hypothetical protein
VWIEEIDERSLSCLKVSVELKIKNKIVEQYHSCIVVRNPGDPWGFGQILLGVYLGLPENLGGVPFFSFFIAFLCDNFSDLTPARAPRVSNNVIFESV